MGRGGMGKGHGMRAKKGRLGNNLWRSQVRDIGEK